MDYSLESIRRKNWFAGGAPTQRSSKRCSLKRWDLAISFAGGQSCVETLTFCSCLWKQHSLCSCWLQPISCSEGKQLLACHQLMSFQPPGASRSVHAATLKPVLVLPFLPPSCSEAPLFPACAHPHRDEIAT